MNNTSPESALSSEEVLYSHLELIRTALWRNSTAGRASVMIGAGFSRQSESLALSGTRFPLWSDLRRKLAETLRLPADDQSEVLNVAQLFEERFGRAALDDAIIESIPDAAFGPGACHRRLLALPWADVFTTNYDTLLERASVDIFERRYERIVVAADLPMRASPRIVKLHGTLPSHRPFIVTKGDYLEYPQKHAPFVNLVRQAAMETLLVLLGFSGRDPNFQEWTRWVQEQLGLHAPPIYLCGVLDLTAEDRERMVRQRVIPVDLGLLFPVGKYPDRDARHAIACTWLLEVLARGKPLRPLEWAPMHPPEVAPLQPHGPAAKQFTGFSESWPKHDHSLTAEKLREISLIWQKQRREYPGWLVAPDVVRNRTWHGTEHWRHAIFQHCDLLPLTEQLQLLRETVWRLDLCLQSMWTEEASQISALLERCNPFPGLLELPAAEPLIAGSSAELADAWVELALAVIRVAREDLNEAIHALWMGRLLGLAPSFPSLGPKIWAEDAYWALARLDLDELDRQLPLWSANDRTLLGRAKLAALWAELGKTEKARELAAEVLQMLRSKLGALQSPLELLSLEAWLITLLELVRAWPWPRPPEVRERMAELRRWNCSPEEVTDGLRSTLKDFEPPRRPERTEVPDFDPGRRNVSRQMNSGINLDDLIPAFVALRVIEVAPCALRSQNVNYIADETARAASWLQFIAPYWATGMLIRSNNKEGLEHFLGRPTAALLPHEQIERMWGMLHRFASQVLARTPENFREAHDSTVCRMGVIGLELLSRIAFRLKPAALDELLEQVLCWLRSERAMRAWSYDDPVRSLLNRTIYALPPEKLSEAAARLLAVPVLGEDGFKRHEHSQWPDPAEALFGRDDWLADHPVVPPELAARLIRLLVDPDKETVRRAALRLSFLHERGWLAPEQVSTFGDTMWGRVEPLTGLPVAWHSVQMLLRLPGAEVYGAKAKFHAKLTAAVFAPLTQSDGKSMRTDVLAVLREQLEDVRRNCGVFFREPARICIGPEEARRMLQNFATWWAQNRATMVEIARGERWKFLFEAESATAVAESFAAVVGECLMPALRDDVEAGRQAAAWVGKTEQDGFNAGLAAIGLQAAGVIGTVETAQRVTRLLLGETRRDINDGCWLVVSWLRAHRSGLIAEAPPTAMVDMLVQRAAMRTEPALDLVCDWLAQIIKEFGDLVSEQNRSLMLRSLEALAEATDLVRWQREHARGMTERTKAYRLMELGESAVGLASSLAKDASKRHAAAEPILDRWRKLAAESPLPEMQRAWIG
jgi:hypothetical protein